MRQRIYQPCIPRRSTTVPTGPDWLHEIKHDGYRLIVARDGARVRLFTRRGYDWSERYPLIVEAASRLRTKTFVIEGEAVIRATAVSPISTAFIPGDVTVRSG
jgi:bifunctional non-homologous end joining protein LigD